MIWIPSPNDGWTQTQKAQNNEFIETGLENWAKISWMTNKVNSNDKNRKIDWFQLKKIVFGTIQGDQFLYISLRFDYKFASWLLQCFSLDFSITCLIASFSFYTLLSFHFYPLRANQTVGVWYLSHQHLPKVFT